MAASDSPPAASPATEHEATASAPLPATRRARPVSIETASSDSSESFGRARIVKTAEVEVETVTAAATARPTTNDNVLEADRLERVIVEDGRATASAYRRTSRDIERLIERPDYSGRRHDFETPDARPATYDNDREVRRQERVVREDAREALSEYRRHLERLVERPAYSERRHDFETFDARPAINGKAPEDNRQERVVRDDARATAPPYPRWSPYIERDIERPDYSVRRHDFDIPGGRPATDDNASDIDRLERVRVEDGRATTSAYRRTRDVERDGLIERAEHPRRSSRERSEDRRREIRRQEAEVSIFEWGEDVQLEHTKLDMADVAKYYHDEASTRDQDGAEAASRDMPRDAPTRSGFGISSASSSRAPPREPPSWVKTTAPSDLAKHKLYVVRRTSQDIELTSGLLKDLGVDNGFLAAHRKGERYRQSTALRGKSDFKLPSATTTYKMPGVVSEDYYPRPLYPWDFTEDWVSVWEGAHASVMIIQHRPIYQSGALNKFEEALADSLRQHTGTGRVAAGVVHDATVQIVHMEWLRFFDSVEDKTKMDLRTRFEGDTKRLCGNIAWALEQNLVTARLCQKEARRAMLNGPPPAYDTLDAINIDDWKELIARLQRMMAVISLLQPVHIPHVPEPVWRPVRPVSRPATSTSIDTTEIVPVDDTPQGQNSLGRVSYMGGILLPFSIIAGIMSMAEPYGPGNNLFWIYWAITIPITCLTLTIIYADDIRNMGVYKLKSESWLQEAIKNGVVEDPDDKLSLDSDSDVSYGETRAAWLRRGDELRAERLLSERVDGEEEQAERGRERRRRRERDDDDEDYAYAEDSDRRLRHYRRSRLKRRLPAEAEELVERTFERPTSATSLPLVSPERVELGQVAGGSAPELPVEAALEVGEEANNIDQGNVELATAALKARSRRRFPLGWFSRSRPANQAPPPADIEMGRPGSRPSIPGYRPGAPEEITIDFPERLPTRSHRRAEFSIMPEPEDRNRMERSRSRPTRVRYRPSFRPGEYYRPGYDRPRYDRPRYDRPRYDRPRYDRPEYDRPGYDWRDSTGRRYSRARNVDAPGRPNIVIEESPGGEKRVYQREKLGWGGALKTMVGYEKHPETLEEETYRPRARESRGRL